ncbi:MAG: hypothetical protein Q7K39_02235 [Candidatus Magasanikbacteria bacterium]|nr:hypothetical protein [Candidatus Magasanikbacteria bacterium]
MFKPTKQKILAYAIFLGLGLILIQIPFTALVGAKARFNMFDFFAPIIGGFLGSIPGALSVLSIQLFNWAIHGFDISLPTLIRFLPILAATLYFSRKSFLQLAIAPICILAFLAHPEGRGAAVFTLYWFIPIAMYFLQNKFVLARALGATFTAHAVGGALWIWAFNMKSALWLSLLPIVWKERGLMALGITLGYLAFKWLLERDAVRAHLKLVITPHA